MNIKELKNYTIEEIEKNLTNVVSTISETSIYDYNLRLDMINKLEEYLSVKNEENTTNKHYFRFYLEPYIFIFSLLTEKTNKKEKVSELKHSYVKKVKGIKLKSMYVTTEEGHSNYEDISCSVDKDRSSFKLLPLGETDNIIDENSWRFFSQFNITDKKSVIVDFFEKKFVKNKLYENIDFKVCDVEFLKYRFKDFNYVKPNNIKTDNELIRYLFDSNKEFLFNFHIENSYINSFFKK